MNKLRIKSIVAMPMVLSAASMAVGQAGSITVKAGVGQLTTNKTGDATEKSGWFVGLGYNLATLMSGNTPLQPSINLDFFRTGSSGNELNSFGLTWEFRFNLPTGGLGGGFRPYAGLGLGLFHTHIDTTILTGGSGGSGAFTAGRNRGSSSGGSGGGLVRINETQTRVGGKLILGAWLSDSIFIEGTYRLSPKIADFRTDTLNLMIGIRF